MKERIRRCRSEAQEEEDVPSCEQTVGSVSRLVFFLELVTNKKTAKNTVGLVL